MARLLPAFLALGVLFAPLLALGDVEVQVQKKPASVTAEQERAVNAKYAKDAEIARKLTDQIRRATPKNARQHDIKPAAVRQLSVADASIDAKPHKSSHHGKVIEVSHHRRRQQ